MLKITLSEILNNVIDINLRRKIVHTMYNVKFIIVFPVYDCENLLFYEQSNIAESAPPSERI